MDDSDGRTTHIASSWKSITDKTDSWMLTDAVKYHHQGTDSLKCMNVAIQTQQAHEGDNETITCGYISDEVLTLLLSVMKSNNEDTNILARLNIFHHIDSVTLSVVKQLTFLQKEELPLHSVVCGVNGRAAFLFAERYHDTWCSHNGIIILWQRRIMNRLVVSSCPTVLRYGPQGLIIVGLKTGHILMILNGEVISTKKAHTLSVTSFEWLPSLQQLVSVSLDGRIIIHVLKSTTLEEKHSKLVTVANLPRTIKKSHSVTKHIGLTSLCVVKDRLFVGSETGAVWIATVPDLVLFPFHFEIDCIESLTHISNYVVIVTSSGKGTVVSSDAATIRVLDTQICNVCVTNGSIVLYGNYKQIQAVQATTLKMLMKQNITHQVFTLVPDDNLLLLVDEELLTTFYRINCNQ